MISLHSGEQLRALTYLQLMIMHASLDTDIHEGMERDGSSTQCARTIVGFVPILPFDFRENGILEGCIENAVEERTREISTLAPLFILDRDEQWRHRGFRQKYPNYSRSLGDWSSILFLRSEARASMNNQWNSQTLLKKEIHRYLVLMLISFISIVMSVSYNNEIISEKLSKETEKERERIFE